jgi:hypothetical protein
LPVQAQGPAYTGGSDQRNHCRDDVLVINATDEPLARLLAVPCRRATVENSLLVGKTEAADALWGRQYAGWCGI